MSCMSQQTPQSGYWIDVAVADILQRFPEGDIILSSGISPSASYHIGHFREIMTADALTWGLKRAAKSRTVKHVHVVDNFDPLRDKPNPVWPKDWDYKQFVGWPICLVPDPYEACRDEHKTYAEHFYREFEGYAGKMGIVPDEVVRGYEDLYENGQMAANIEKAVEGVAAIKQIFKEVSNRDLPEGWMPLQLLGPNNGFTELKFSSIDTGRQIIIGVDEAGREHELRYAKGQVKLPWRLDWPARWNVLGVKVEPFSAQEHGAAGGSYATGALISRQVFGYEPPIPAVEYGNIHMLGDTKKMSSSKGNLVTPAQALEIMPPEVLRYFVVRSRPERTLYWDSGQGLFNLIREFVATEEAVESGQKPEFAEAYDFAVAPGQAKTISSVPFDHLVQVWQAARGQEQAALEMLVRTGFEKQVHKQGDALKSEFKFVANWLAKYAPEEVKFTVQEDLPQVELSEGQQKFLDALAGKVEAEKLDGQGMHEAIYAAKDEAGLQPGEAFKAIYRVILGKDFGPKAGWFLASLEHDWLVARLRRQS